MTETTLAEQDAYVHVDPDLTIFERIGAIVAEMPAIGKGQRNTQQNFMYRGHDDVMNALNPLLSKYGVFFAPRVLERVTDQRTTAARKVMYEVNLHVQYVFYGPKGDSLVASAWGEGTDSGDKSTNKAMTMALKNVLAQVFAVSTEEQSKYDTDQHTDEDTSGRTARDHAAAAKFTPESGLLPGAPSSGAELEALILDLDSTLGDWVTEAIFKLYGTTSTSSLDPALKRQAFCRVANTIFSITALFKDGDFPPPSDDEYREVFAWGFDGLRIEGPGTPFDDPEAVAAFEDALDHEGDTSGAVPAAAGADLPAADAPEQQEPLPDAQTGYDGLGDQGHIGTAAPDE